MSPASGVASAPEPIPNAAVVDYLVTRAGADAERLRVV
jgi:hypothetical protein